MKKLSVLVSLLTLIAFCPSCKKDHSGCQPHRTPCPPNPYAVGQAVYPQGLQAGTDVFNVVINFINPNNPDLDSCLMVFTIGGLEYFRSTSPLPTADSQNLGSFEGTIAIGDSLYTANGRHWDAVTYGYNTPQRCDCDPSAFQSHYSEPSNALPSSSLAAKQNVATTEIDGVMFSAKSTDLLEKIIKRAKSTDLITRIKKPGIRRRELY